MGKRSNFERMPRDYYKTPREAVAPLVPHLVEYSNFAEPCAGDGTLTDHIVGMAKLHSYWESDIEPQNPRMQQIDALALSTPLKQADCVITNPPWDRMVLHPMIDHFRRFAPTWLLFDADWMHTKQSARYMEHCKKVVSVGRVKWIEGSKMTGKDNCAWYLFDTGLYDTIFCGHPYNP